MKKAELMTIFLGIAIVLVRLPPFALSQSALFTSHNIARLIFLILFCAIFYLVYRLKGKLSLKIDKKLIYLLLFFFASQSISALGASNTEAFLSVYKDNIFSILAFAVAFFIINKDNIIFFIGILLFASTINLFFQTLTLFFPQTVYPILKFVIYEKYWQFFDYQFNRGRFFGNSFDEVIIPLIFLFFFINKGSFRRIFLAVLTGLNGFIVLSSNWRTKTIMFIFALLSSIMVLKPVKKYLILFFLLISISYYLAGKVSVELTGTNVISRLLLEDSMEAKSITGRLTYWKEAAEIGQSSILFGVGLGNYYDNLIRKSQFLSQRSIIDRATSFTLIDDPHNLFFSTFASTGLFGLTSLMFLVLFFFKSDISSLKKENKILSCLIISFWALFIYAVLNPWQFFSYLMFFWIMRGMIEKLRVIYDIRN